MVTTNQRDPTKQTEQETNESKPMATKEANIGTRHSSSHDIGEPDTNHRVEDVLYSG